MLIKGVIDEDFTNFKIPSLFIATAMCDFKCEKESGVRCCQNSALAKKKNHDVSIEYLIDRYFFNLISKAVVFGGLEPFMQWDDLLMFIKTFRTVYRSYVPIVIYTGYNKTEISYQIEELKKYKNIIVKFGRFVPNQEPHFDEVLGVNLASPNQYAEQIS